MDDMVLIALSTSTAVSGVATSVFGAVNSFFGIIEPEPVQERLDRELDLSDISISRPFQENFSRMLFAAKCTNKASEKLDNLIRCDKIRAYEISRICHYLRQVYVQS